MKDIILAKKELNNLPLLHPKAEGAYGEVVAYKDGVIKRFKDDISIDMKKRIEDNIKRKSEIFIYPKCKVYEKNNIDITYLRGYFMDKAPGIDLLSLRNGILSGRLDMSFNQILTIYYDKLLPCLINENVLISDMKLCQMFIDDNFYFVDTDPFITSNTKLLSFYNFSSAYEWNLNEINVILTSMLDMLFDYKVQSNLEYFDDDYLYDYINNAKRLTGGKVKTFGEFSKYIG